MQKHIRDRGSITIEAAIVLPVFICVVISLAMLIKLVYVHEVIQHAIDEAANELAAYAYIYHISDLQTIDDSIQDNLEENAQQAEGHAEAVVGAFGALEDAYKGVEDIKNEWPASSSTTGSFSSRVDLILRQAEETLSQGTQITEKSLGSMERLYKVFEEASENPKKEAISMAWLVSKGIYSNVKTIIAVPMIKHTVKKYLKNAKGEDVESALKSLNICKGFDGLDFYESAIFNNNENIDIVVKYKVELPLPIKILPDLYLIQRSTARAWLDGGDGTALAETSIWDLPNKQRGMKIEELYGGNLPYDFPVIDIFDAGSKTGTSIKSINLNSKTYQDNAKLSRTLKQYVDDLKNCNTISYKQESYIISVKKLIIVIPKGALNDSNSSTLEQIKAYAASSGMDITIKEL